MCVNDGCWLLMRIREFDFVDWHQRWAALNPQGDRRSVNLFATGQVASSEILYRLIKLGLRSAWAMFQGSPVRGAKIGFVDVADRSFESSTVSAQVVQKGLARFGTELEFVGSRVWGDDYTLDVQVGISSWGWSFTISSPADPGPAVANTWGEVLAAALRDPELAQPASWGAVWYDHSYQRTPYYKWYGLAAFPELNENPNLVRGYHWANLLSQASGMVETSAPMPSSLIVEVPPGCSGRQFVRARDPLGAFDDESLLAVKELLDPLLIPATYDFYKGPPLRIIRDPGTAWYREPTDGLPEFEDGPVIAAKRISQLPLAPTVDPDVMKYAEDLRMAEADNDLPLPDLD